MARDRLSSDYSENMSDATTCSCMVNSVEKCSVRSCGSMFQEPFFLHPPGSRPRDGLYINPMSSPFQSPTRTKDSNNTNGESFYLHSPHDLVYTRITHLFDEADRSSVVASSNGSSSRSGERKDDTVTVKVDVHMNNGTLKALANGSSPGSLRSAGDAAKDSGSEHAYEQICIKAEDQPPPPPPPAPTSGSPKYSSAHKKIADNASDTRSRKSDRRYSRSSSASESSNMSSEVQCYSSTTSTPSLSRNSSNERISKSPKVPDTPTERKTSTTSSTRAESEKEAKPTMNGPSIFRPPPPPPPPPPEVEEVVIMTSKVVENSYKEEKRQDGSQSCTQEQKCEATITTISAAAAAVDDRPAESLLTPQEDLQTTTTSTSQTTTTLVTAHLVNRHMVLPFIPPKFASQAADSETLLKPSEYLRSICKAAVVTGNTSSLSKARSVDNLDIQGRGNEEETRKSESEEEQERSVASGPPPPPLPPPLTNGLTHQPSSTSSATSETDSPAKPNPQQQPLATISIQDLTSVQLRRTNVKMHATKTFSAPPNRSVSMTNVSEPFFVQKTDLIAELKQTKDIPGIKKLKVERAQVEKSQEQTLISEINKAFSISKFVEQIPEKDSSGNVIPIWKRQMLARKAAERAKKELEEQIARENEEKRIKAIPPWKRQLLAKKDSDIKCTGLTTTHCPLTATPAKIEVPKKEPPVESPTIQPPPPLPASPPVNSVPATPSKSLEDTKSEVVNNNHEDKKNNETDDDDTDKVHIIPWRAQLRKTNSKLNILD